MLLIAIWDPSQDPASEPPRSVRWEDGREATIEDYQKHIDDTHTILIGPEGLEKHIFTEVVADVIFDRGRGAWIITGPGVNPDVLDVTDPEAKDDEITAALYMLPIVYKAVIRR